jgi:hypothetical protein
MMMMMMIHISTEIDGSPGFFEIGAQSPSHVGASINGGQACEHDMGNSVIYIRRGHA